MTYGSVLEPNDLGSGGGSIYVTTGTLSGSGLISADGGEYTGFTSGGGGVL
jgi:hypothetical protein